MKNCYIGILALALCSTGFTQGVVSNTMRLSQRLDNGSVIATTTPLTEKGITLWEDDFATLTNWTVTATGANTHEWYRETALASPAGLGDFASSSAGNGFLMVNSDANNTGDGQGTPIITDVTSSAIDLSATGVTGMAEMNVVLEFQHNFRWWQDIREVHVSGDGGSTWTIYPISDATGNVIGAAAQNSENPEVTTLDISTEAGGSNNVLVRFHYDDQDFWGWYWMVDDVKIKRQDADDLVAVTSYFGSLGLPYFSIPSTQVAPIDFYTVTSNAGSTDQALSIVTADVNSGSFVGTSAGMTLASGATDTLNVTTQYTPAVGNHAVTWTVSSSATDLSPLDNVDADAFDVVSAVGQYGRDRGVYQSQGGGEDGDPALVNPEFAFEAGSVFDIFADQQVFAIDVVIGTDTPPGTIIYGKLYEDDGAGGFLYIDETEEYATTQADADNNVTVHLNLYTSPTLLAGTVYYPMVGCYTEFYYGRSGESEPQTSFILYGGAGGSGNQYYTTSTPMVRMNFNESNGVTENVTENMELGQNIPNPFNNTTAINYSVAANANVTLTVVDMTGKVVLTVNEGTKAAGDYKIILDASTLAGGMYHYTLSNGETSITKAMSVIK